MHCCALALGQRESGYAGLRGAAPKGRNARTQPKHKQASRRLIASCDGPRKSNNAFRPRAMLSKCTADANNAMSQRLLIALRKSHTEPRLLHPRHRATNVDGDQEGHGRLVSDSSTAATTAQVSCACGHICRVPQQQGHDDHFPASASCESFLSLRNGLLKCLSPKASSDAAEWMPIRPDGDADANSVIRAPRV